MGGAVAGCTSSESDSGSGPTTKPEPEVTFEATAPEEIARPAAEGKGINVPQPAPPLPEGYLQEEYFIGGTAAGFEAIDTPDDGHWSARPGDTAEYRTRVIVRRPASAPAFSGTVLVEWFNVSAVEAAPDWGYLAGAIGREGHAYVGISAQAQGVEGGDTLLAVDVDEQAAGQAPAAADTSGLKNIDPDRYGTLVHPGDAYSYDILNQIGRALTDSPAELLGDLAPSRIIAVGESQSSMYLTTYVNAIHPLAKVFDGFLIHSRGSLAPQLDGTLVRSRKGVTATEVLGKGVLIREDLDVPVMMVETETDLTLLGYTYARQADTERIRTWEVAGTAHADSETIRAVIGGARDPGVGVLLGCGTVNSGPHKEVLRAAVHHLATWVGGGDPPPAGTPIETTDDGDVAIVRDERGNALGGIRNPLVDVPAATLTGDPPEGVSAEDLLDGANLCPLFGRTAPFDAATMASLYGDADTYLQRFRASTDEAVAAGFMLRPDADALLADVEPNRELFP